MRMRMRMRMPSDGFSSIIYQTGPSNLMIVLFVALTNRKLKLGKLKYMGLLTQSEAHAIDDTSLIYASKCMLPFTPRISHCSMRSRFCGVRSLEKLSGILIAVVSKL